ncbi:hypothetical protein QO034_10725 [Sedimentitalea sp. JM2-8]|uniref:Uncharacterized protein n=1 Tax=Sedimentitalea xiamensis TaxID=3050037 RepID=A0ABT7FEN7_9RHOB|nr:hypothetical protein [Sedimentitalea xiamensis]MDK3073585.1 hypothetical protein [Sedimentitalea xiamensis]
MRGLYAGSAGNAKRQEEPGGGPDAKPAGQGRGGHPVRPPPGAGPAGIPAPRRRKTLVWRAILL